jgi:hypothetical protein
MEGNDVVADPTKGRSERTSRSADADDGNLHDGSIPVPAPSGAVRLVQ